MTTKPDLLTDEFRALSARLGSDPLQVQGAGGNTSIKDGAVMWIKASGTQLAQANTEEIFVAVDRRAALAEAREQAGDGSCKTTVIDPAVTLRPSIETTFHAAFDHAVVAHTHSISTLVHVICAEGRKEAARKLEGLPFVLVPYAKPGLPLTREIMARVTPETQVVLLQNHGLICCGGSVTEVSHLIADVEHRLRLGPSSKPDNASTGAVPDGYAWSDHGWIGRDPRAAKAALAGSYYPDHVVFLGPGLPGPDTAEGRPAVVVEGQGVLLREDATAAQRAMLKCLSDVLQRVPEGWHPEPIGPEAEAELLNWDAEKYRQALAARS
ncbi:MAG: class II aldolase/adducin family protein [Pseudomonadota bacterium]